MLTTQTPTNGPVHAAVMSDPEVSERPDAATLHRRLQAGHPARGRTPPPRRAGSAPSSAASGCTAATSSTGAGHRDRGALDALARPSGRPRPNPLAGEVERLRRENARLSRPPHDGRADHRDPVKSLRSAGHPAGPGERGRADRVLMETALAVAPEIGMVTACRALGVSRATAYRRRSPRPRGERRPRPLPVMALTDEERQAVLAQLHAERFVDRSPAAVYATLLDEGTYLASERTMYRILAARGRDRRAARPAAPPRLRQARAPGHRDPNQLWSWDITKLKGPAAWTLLPPLRAARRVQPLRGRLAARAPGERDPRGPAHRRDGRAGRASRRGSPSMPTGGRR